MIWMDVDTALSEVPVNLLPLIDDSDFKSREESVVYNQAGLDLVWNFVTTGGAMTQTAVTPTTAGVHDWANQGNGMYSIEIPDTGGTINNDTEGYGWFVGYATGILPWRGPVIGFRASGLNDKLIDSAYDTTRGLAGTALPGIAAEGAGGLYTRGSGAGQINQQTAGQVDSNLARWLNVAPLALTSQRVNSNVGAMAANVLTAAAINAAAITSAKFGSGAITSTVLADDAITAAKIAASAITSSEAPNLDAAITSRASSSALTTHDGKLDTVDANVDAILVDTGTTLDAALAVVDGNVDSILADTAEIGAAGVGLTEAGGDGDHLTAINLPNQTMDITGDITGNLSGSVGNVTAEVTADVVKISGSSNAADNLEASAETIVVGAAATGTLSTTQMTTDLTEATDNHYNGRIIIWTSGVLKDQATDIVDYDGASKMLTFTAVTEAPSNGDTFVIV